MIILENKKIKKNKLFIFEILVFIILIGVIFYETYFIFINNSSSSYEKNIKNNIKELNIINDEMGKYNLGQALNAKKLENLRESMPQYVEKLNNIKNNFDKMVPEEKYKSDHTNLMNGLEKNILIFRQAEAILKDPEGKDVNVAADNLKKYRDDCLNYYSKINSKKMKVSLSSNCINFINNTLNYANTMARITKDKEISLNQNIEFINNMDLIISKFSSIKIDFSPQLLDENKDLNNIISIASNKSDELYILKQDFSNISIPPKALETYKLLNEVIENYETYLQKFIDLKQNQDESISNPSSQFINNLYKDSNSLFNTVETNYNKFLKSYNEFKNSNL